MKTRNRQNANRLAQLVGSAFFLCVAMFAKQSVAQTPAAASEQRGVPLSPAVDKTVKSVTGTVVEVPVSSPKKAEGRIAVLDLRSTDVDAPLANALAAVLTSELDRRDGLVAVSRNEVRALLDQQASAALLGCDSERCATDLGGVLDANGIVSGDLAFLDGAYQVSLALIDTEQKQATRRVQWTWRGPAAELVTAAGPAVTRLLLGKGADALRGSLHVEAMDGAEVFLDGTSLGTAPLKSVTQDLPIGVHHVVVTRTGFAEYDGSAVVSADQRAVLQVTLNKLPFYSRGWFWGTVAAATAGVIVTAVSVTGFVLASSIPLPPKVITVHGELPAAASAVIGAAQ